MIDSEGEACIDLQEHLIDLHTVGRRRPSS
jgi:hypothetical protein